MNRIKLLFTQIVVGLPYQAPNWEQPVTVATINEIKFTIEDSDIYDVGIVFTDTQGKVHIVSPDWEDSLQGYTLEV